MLFRRKRTRRTTLKSLYLDWRYEKPKIDQELYATLLMYLDMDEIRSLAVSNMDLSEDIIHNLTWLELFLDDETAREVILLVGGKHVPTC